MEEKLRKAHRDLKEKRGPGAEYTGWLSLPGRIDKAEYLRVKAAASRIRRQSKALVVIGIGGSYLGARAAIEFLFTGAYNERSLDAPRVYFAGNGLSGKQVQTVLELLGDADFSVLVVSKSGSTLEPALAFELFLERLERKYGKQGAADRVYVTTDAKKGALKARAVREGFETFTVPDDIGGRYSVLSSVGLLPMAAMGADTDGILLGAYQAMRALCEENVQNPAWRYAAARNRMYEQGKKLELLSIFEPDFRSLGEWWKQLFGESEGKEHKGLFPVCAELTADLHSLGQYIQEGERHLFETMLDVGEDRAPTRVVPGEDWAYLDGRSFYEINRQARLAAALAHADGGVPNLTVTLERADARGLGWLFYFFELSCALSGYVLGVNPFDQPGVEEYKKNMFALLGKTGGQDRQRLLSRIAERESQ